MTEADSIVVKGLSKSFHVKRKTGSKIPGKRFEKAIVEAVKNVSFTIKRGERVAFIGPNGAGKSTTLKMLSGILYPSAGHATVAGLVPWEQRRALSYKIGLVFGQRSQLWYHLPVIQSFDLLGKIYGMNDAHYTAQRNKLVTLFHLQDLIERPVKSLSLGQRMRSEIAASLLHDPEILFLDEPTIGLDVTTKAELRDHLRAISDNAGTTVILTSHDTNDIEHICDRVILINHGEKLIDTSLDDMRKTYLRHKQLRLTTVEENPILDLPDGVTSATEPHMLVIDVDPSIMPMAQVINHAMKTLDVTDLSISDQDLEEVFCQIYTENRL